MIDIDNPLAKAHRMKRDNVVEDETSNIKVKLIRTRTKDPLTYNTMSVNEFVALIMNDDTSDVCERDIILETRSNKFCLIHEIASLHRFNLLKRCSDPPKIEPAYTLESSLHLDFKIDEQKME
ncbi:hypothetical protein V2J09_004839 [Rumex salicifolius]